MTYVGLRQINRIRHKILLRNFALDLFLRW